MIRSKLIVLDGLPGAGKTTTGQWLKIQLERNGIPVVWIQEADVQHPLWWYDIWDGTQYLPPDFEHTPVENSAGNWSQYEQQILDFMDLPQ